MGGGTGGNLRGHIWTKFSVLCFPSIVRNYVICPRFLAGKGQGGQTPTQRGSSSRPEQCHVLPPTTGRAGAEPGCRVCHTRVSCFCLSLFSSPSFSSTTPPSPLSSPFPFFFLFLFLFLLLLYFIVTIITTFILTM